MIFEDSQKFLLKLFEKAKKESIYIYQLKHQEEETNSATQITITLFIIINKEDI